jgi:hypothetical protein
VMILFGDGTCVCVYARAHTCVLMYMGVCVFFYSTCIIQLQIQQMLTVVSLVQTEYFYLQISYFTFVVSCFMYFMFVCCPCNWPLGCCVSTLIIRN